VNERRQRTAPALGTGIVALCLLTLGGGCQAGSSVEGAQTAIAVAQTALPGLETALPGVQATAQAGATLISGVLSDPLAINARLQALLAGVTVDATTTPAGAPNDAVTQVRITGTDAGGTFAQLDALSRRATTTGALMLISQYYPNATIALTVIDGGGATLASGSKSPGGAPVVSN
jgi:hypothetical protein